MGTRPLGDRYVRRIQRSVRQPLVRAVGTGGYVMEFVTADHRHGWWNKVTREHGYYDNPMHLSSCARLFPEGSTLHTYLLACDFGRKPDGEWCRETYAWAGLLPPGAGMDEARNAAIASARVHGWRFSCEEHGERIRVLCPPKVLL